ncbi:MAG: DNA repair protein RadA [Acidimicrobiales bacterium]|nr:DNA repair protein RadA [Acidimicrobiales bacterium]
MVRNLSRYRCGSCGSPAARWTGRCGRCGEWNTLAEDDPRGTASADALPRAPIGLPAVSDSRADPRPTGIGELDRVLGGGIVPSSVTLIAGEPGVGKSTLIVQMLAHLARLGARGLLISAEEAPEQVRRRAARMDALEPGIWIAGHTDLDAVRSAIAELGPDVVVVDSIQTICDPEVDSLPGSVNQVRACAHRLAADARLGGPAVVLIGHVTKDGSIAGPRVLEHVVDTVLTFEGDRHHALRMLRAVKHRFGPTGELGMLEMTPTGLASFPDAGAFLLADRMPGVPGSVVFAAMEGRRPLLVEIQALVGPAAGPPRRAASGYEAGRLGQLLAVLDRRAGLALPHHDVYVSAVGGVRLAEPGADLAVALAVASAATNRLVADDLVVVGEVGLGGELRQVPGAPSRLAEAARLGFRRALTPPGAATEALAITPAATLGEALDRHLGRSASAPRLRLVE